MSDHKSPQPGCDCCACRVARIHQEAWKHGELIALHHDGDTIRRVFLERREYITLPASCGREDSPKNTFLAVFPPDVAKRLPVPPEVSLVAVQEQMAAAKARRAVPSGTLRQMTRPKAAPRGVRKLTPLKPQRSLPCVHLGERTSTIGCASCGGKTVELPVFACSVHGECLTGKPQEELPGCLKCKDYAPKGAAK